MASVHRIAVGSDGSLTVPGRDTAAVPGDEFVLVEEPWGISLVRCAHEPAYVAERAAHADKLDAAWADARAGRTRKVTVDPTTGAVSWR